MSTWQTFAALARHIAWYVIAALWMALTLALIQPSAIGEVLAVQVAASAVLAGSLTAGHRFLWDRFAVPRLAARHHPAQEEQAGR